MFEIKFVNDTDINWVPIWDRNLIISLYVLWIVVIFPDMFISNEFIVANLKGRQYGDPDKISTKNYRNLIQRINFYKALTRL